MTSWPMRGIEIIPQLLPAHPLDTRIQQVRSYSEFSMFCSVESHQNLTLTSPCSLVQISSSGGPTTTAVCGPVERGLGVVRGGRYGKLVGCAFSRNDHRAGSSSLP